MGSSSLIRDRTQVPLCWERRVLATGSPRKSHGLSTLVESLQVTAHGSQSQGSSSCFQERGCLGYRRVESLAGAGGSPLVHLSAPGFLSCTPGRWFAVGTAVCFEDVYHLTCSVLISDPLSSCSKQKCLQVFCHVALAPGDNH